MVFVWFEWCGGALSGYIFHGQLQSVGKILWFQQILSPCLSLKRQREKTASFSCQYSHLNSNGLPLNASFLINYDTNALGLIKKHGRLLKGNGVHTAQHSTHKKPFISHKTQQNMLFNSSLTINSSLFDRVLSCSSHTLVSLWLNAVYALLRTVYTPHQHRSRFFNYAVNYAFHF